MHIIDEYLRRAVVVYAEYVKILHRLAYNGALHRVPLEYGKLILHSLRLLKPQLRGILHHLAAEIVIQLSKVAAQYLLHTLYLLPIFLLADKSCTRP